MDRLVADRFDPEYPCEPSRDRLCSFRTNHRDDTNCKQLSGSADKPIWSGVRCGQQDILIAIDLRSRGSKDGEPVSLSIQPLTKTGTHDTNLQAAWSTLWPPDKSLTKPLCCSCTFCAQQGQVCSRCDLLREPSLHSRGPSPCVRGKRSNLAGLPSSLHKRKQVAGTLGDVLRTGRPPTGFMQQLPKLRLLTRHD